MSGEGENRGGGGGRPEQAGAGAPIEFYFDFLSPFGYIGSIGIEEIGARQGREVDWRPVLLGVTVMKVMGLPPVPETPLKGAYSKRDAPRTARYRGIPWNPADVPAFPPLPAGRAFTWLKDDDPDLARRFARAVYRAHWSEARDVTTPEKLAALGGELGIDPEALLAAIADPGVKARHREWVDLAIARGVFGVPTFIVDGEMFWGSDKLEQVEAWIERGGW